MLIKLRKTSTCRGGARSRPRSAGCHKACLVDPDNEQNHDLHRQILDAKSIGSGLDGVGVGISPR